MEQVSACRVTPILPLAGAMAFSFLVLCMGNLFLLVTEKISSILSYWAGSKLGAKASFPYVFLHLPLLSAR